MSKCGQTLGVAALMAMCSTLINRSLRGGLVVIGGLNPGGSLEVIHNAIDVVALAVEKGPRWSYCLCHPESSW